MIANQKKTYKNQLRLTAWFAGITLFCLALMAVSYYWLHSILLLAIGVMFGPIFGLLTVIFGLMALVNSIAIRRNNA